MPDPDPLSPVTDAFLDRIVEGGLTSAELRGALDRLEREPDGWKRCALAFLEAQCWRESFRAMECDGPPLAQGVERPAIRTRPPSRRLVPDWGRLAMAAGIAAISFALGWRVGPDRDPPRGAELQSPLASGNPPTPTGPTRTAEIADPRDDPGGPTPYQPYVPDPLPPVRTVGRLRVGPADNAPDVPILAGPGIDEQWARNQPPPITEHEQALLEQQGYQVDRRRRLITATLADGRRVTVPVDQVQVRYTGLDPL